jgi:hypothetical protein
MSIKVSEYVDQAGRIYMPYLTEWQYPQYDTIGLLQVMTILFQDKTPVYSTPQSATNSRPSATQPPARPQSTYQPPYPQATSVNTPYPTGPIAMPQQYSAPQPNQPLPYPSTTGYQSPYQPYVGMPAPLSVPSNLDHTVSNQNISTHSLNNTSNFSGYSTIQPSHIRASLTSAIDDRLRQRLKELMGRERFQF